MFTKHYLEYLPNLTSRWYDKCKTDFFLFNPLLKVKESIAYSIYFTSLWLLQLRTLQKKYLTIEVFLELKTI